MVKKIMWHTPFGEIAVRERFFVRPSKQFRPFSTEADICCRGGSLPLQRVIVDFGADQAFGRAGKKWPEHDGISIPVSTIRQLTEHHANRMLEQQTPALEIPDQIGCAQPIGERDGSLIPIVSVAETAKDKRKNQTWHWQEARLSLVHEQGKITPKFGVVCQGSVNDAGQYLLNSAILAGFGRQTQLHTIGDGATWIAEQVWDKFGQQGNYLVDFYHVGDYLAAASSHGAKNETPTNGLEIPKPALKNHAYQPVIQTLEPYLEANDIDDKHAPVRAGHRYLSNRSEPLDYQTALEKGLPIGSGEIENAHRYVIQERLKRPGAWWKAHHADAMFALRVV